MILTLNFSSSYSQIRIKENIELNQIENIGLFKKKTGYNLKAVFILPDSSKLNFKTNSIKISSNEVYDTTLTGIDTSNIYSSTIINKTEKILEIEFYDVEPGQIEISFYPKFSHADSVGILEIIEFNGERIWKGKFVQSYKHSLNYTYSTITPPLAWSFGIELNYPNLLRINKRKTGLRKRLWNTLSDIITLKITKGSNLFSFYNKNYQEVGNQISGTIEKINELYDIKTVGELCANTELEVSGYINGELIAKAGQTIHSQNLNIELEKCMIKPEKKCNIKLIYSDEFGYKNNISNQGAFIIRELSINKGNMYGTLKNLTTGEIADTFKNIEAYGNRFAFVADSAISLTDPLITINAKVIKDFIIITKQEDTNKDKLINNRDDNTDNEIKFEERDIDDTLRASANLRISTSNEIMLGDIKCFQAQEHYNEKKEIDSVRIVEIPYKFNEKPQAYKGKVKCGEGWFWIDYDCWGKNPIKTLSGNKKPFYWDKNWDKAGKTTFQNYNLEKGVIRLCGRYWDENSTYKAALIATTKNNLKDTISLKTIKPDALLTEGTYPHYTYSKDVFNKKFNIDSLCIYWGGKIGMPPQLLKGQMDQESAKKKFDDIEIGWAFVPTYRYEPYLFFKNYKKTIKRYSSNPFYLEFGSNGAGDIPQHKNIKDFDYFRNADLSVWDVLNKYSQLVTDYATKITQTYGIRRYDNTMNYDAYPNVKKKYNEFLTKALKKTKNNLSKASKIANDKMIVYLRDILDYQHIRAQTRIASSYGLLQTMYAFAIENVINYPIDSKFLPEDLNVRENFKYAINLHKHNLNKIKESEFQNGFLNNLLKAIKLWNFNHKNEKQQSYSYEVYEKSLKYLPQKKSEK